MVNDLVEIMSPPQNPAEASGEPWDRVEARIGTILPDDYKVFIETYGSGRIDPFIWVLNPFSSRKYINLLGQRVMQLSALKEPKDKFDDECPYPLYPESGGLLPCAMTDNGDVIHWLTVGPANEWSIVVNGGRVPVYKSYRMNLTAFLAGLLTGTVRCSIFPQDAFVEKPNFEVN
jgi:hypothetical protein